MKVDLFLSTFAKTDEFTLYRIVNLIRSHRRLGKLWIGRYDTKEVLLTVDTKIGSTELNVMRRSQPSEPTEDEVNGTWVVCNYYKQILVKKNVHLCSVLKKNNLRIGTFLTSVSKRNIADEMPSLRL